MEGVASPVEGEDEVGLGMRTETSVGGEGGTEDSEDGASEEEPDGILAPLPFGPRLWPLARSIAEKEGKKGVGAFCVVDSHNWSIGPHGSSRRKAAQALMMSLPSQIPEQ